MADDKADEKIEQYNASIERQVGNAVLTDPVELLVAVGVENSQLHEELRQVYAELDRYRNALTIISRMQYAPAATVATRALAQKVING